MSFWDTLDLASLFLDQPHTGQARELFAADPDADALQLGAALKWSRTRPAEHGFVCFDVRLREAAGREGFDVRPTAMWSRVPIWRPAPRWRDKGRPEAA